jgi:CheY-like chemotaxis protein
MTIRVLVVEDDEGDAFLMQELLTELRDQAGEESAARFEPVWADSMTGALDVIRSSRCDVAILDLEVGGARGTEALSALDRKSVV